jgi:hypothetical protein
MLAGTLRRHCVTIGTGTAAGCSWSHAHARARRELLEQPGGLDQMREMALLAPEAAPTCSGRTDASTVEVSGATVTAMPRPKTTTAGRTVVT